MKDLRTIVLAAGKGTRMRSEIPKVLHKVCARPLIQYVLGVVKAVGSLKTYVVLGHKAELVKQFIGDQYIFVHQKKLLGTADAVRCVEKPLKGFRGDVLIVCGDTPLLSAGTVKTLINKHRRTKAVCTLLTTVVHNPQGYGRIIRDEHGQIVAIREDKDAVGLERNISEINVAVYCFDSKQLYAALKEIKLNAKKHEFYLTDIIDLFTQKKLKVETVETDDPTECLGINTREDLARAEKYVRRKVVHDLMAGGVTLIDPETTFVDASATIGRDTIIRPFTVIDENVKIGQNCVIGPFAHLRPGTRIGNQVEIGNFTEVSRTKIGHRTLMKHFSFLGDAVLGQDVNIGAGTVTANYDGTKKNPTTIGNKAFIGSDAILVAPIKIGRKSVVGAGSVVTSGHHVPDGKIAVGVPARIIKTARRT